MSEGTLPKVTWKTAAEACQHANLNSEAVALLTDQLTPREYLDRLVEKGMWNDACQFLAHALPKREAIWWALQCVRPVIEAKPAPADVAALQVVEKWVLDPKEAHRMPAEAATEAAGGINTAAGALAQATAWTGGSLTPPHLVPVPPPEHVANVAAYVAVALAAAAVKPENMDEPLAKYLPLGVDVANGTNRWKEPEPAPLPSPAARPAPRPVSARHKS